MRGSGRTVRRFIALTGCLSALLAPAARGQGITLNGRVTDAASGEPLRDTRVTVQVPRTGGVALTDANGRFRLHVGVSDSIVCTVARIGYAPQRLVRLAGTIDTALDVALEPLRIPLDPVVVTASRGEGVAQDAPAAVSVVERGQVDERPAATPIDHTRATPGMDMAAKGLIQRTYAVRGERGATSGALLTLTDGRYAELPSLSINIPYLVAAGDEDLERVEVVRGPGSALYGPGADRGVLQFVTRSPFTSPGATVTLTAGEREMAGAAFRWAGRLGPHLALKVSGDYLRGRDWPYTDPTEAANRQGALDDGADADTLLVGRRDPILERAGGEVRLDWRPGTRTEVMTAAGLTDAIRNVDLASDVGAVQGDHWRYTYLQTRITHGAFTANAFYNASNTGSTYMLRNGGPVVDSSRAAVAQAQHQLRLGPAEVRYGADVRWTDPRTGGTINGENEDHDQITEVGAYAHGTVPLGRRAELVAALRADHHDRLGDLVLSPRLGVVYRPAPAHAFRLTVNRAFTSPDANTLFADIPQGDFGPYTVRASSVPRGGYHFDRDCGGPCVRSPLEPATPQALDAAALWPTAVVLANEAFGVDLSGLPAPTSAEVGVGLAALDPYTQAFVPVDPSAVTDIAALRRTVTSAVEVGWKGVLGERASLTVDAWVSRVQDPRGARYTATPNAFYDPASLAAYLGNYLPASTAESLAAAVGMLPLGTVSPVETAHPTDLLVLSRQGGHYTLGGVDIGAEVSLSRRFWARGGASWLSDDSLAASSGAVYIIGASRQKAYAGLTWRQVERERAAGIEARWVTGFPVNSGVFEGRVASYLVVDAFLSAPVPFAPRTTVLLEAGNLLDRRHQEYVGAPPLGRLVVARLRTRF